MKKRRNYISKVEVLNISLHGIWVYANKKEYFLSYKEFPWFKKATLSQIHRVRLLHDHHLHWPDLDVDVDIHSLGNLEKYSLIAK